MQQAEERAQRQLWYFDSESGTVEEVTGYDCGQEEHPGYWWVPSQGVSACVGFSLFETEREARQRAIDVLTPLLDRMTAQRDDHRAWLS